MDRQQIVEFLHSVGGPNIPIVHHQNWVNFSCLFGPYLHAGGTDTHPSAGISINDECSIYNCKSCHTKGPLHWIVREYMECSGANLFDLAEELKEESLFAGILPSWNSPKIQVRELPEPLDSTIYLDLYDPAFDHPYVNKTRGIDSATARLLDLRVDPADSGGKERILFPVYTKDWKFYGFTGRATDNSAYPPVRDYHGLPKEFLLLGSHLIPNKAEYLLIVEGLFDMARAIQNRQPAVAMMGSSLTERQIDVLIDIGLPVYMFHDNDKAGRDAQEKMKHSRLLRHIPVMKVRYPRRIITLQDGTKKPIKDPDELRIEEVAKMIKEARLL